MSHPTIYLVLFRYGKEVYCGARGGLQMTAYSTRNEAILEARRIRHERCYFGGALRAGGESEL